MRSQQVQYKLLNGILINTYHLAIISNQNLMVSDQQLQFEKEFTIIQ